MQQNQRIAVHPGEALFLAGLASSITAGKKTARNRLSLGTYPFPTRAVAGRRVVLVADVLAALGVKK